VPEPDDEFLSIGRFRDRCLSAQSGNAQTFHSLASLGQNQQHGGAVAVDDEEMIRVTREVGSSEGLFVSRKAQLVSQL
jgi:hypothetical protein